jgi:hypothetical protein
MIDPGEVWVTLYCLAVGIVKCDTVRWMPTGRLQVMWTDRGKVILDDCDWYISFDDAFRDAMDRKRRAVLNAKRHLSELERIVFLPDGKLTYEPIHLKVVKHEDSTGID